MPIHREPPPRFFELLREATEASDRVDEYNLNNDDPQSRLEWSELLEAHTDAVMALMHHVLIYYSDIKATLEEINKPRE